MAKSNLTSISSALFLFSVVLLHCSGIQAENSTHLHFYFHEIYAGPNATVITVVNPPKNDSNFGAIGVADDMLKEGSDPSSKLIGRVQGLASSTSMANDGSFLTLVNFVFTDGMYNGSSLAIFGKYLQGVAHERAIVGGTGQFRMARGYTLIKPVPSSEQGLLILEFDAYISY